MNFLASLEKQSKPFLLLGGFTLIGLIGLIEFLTGYEIAFSAFYILPISLVTWLTGRRLGLVASLVSALVWLGADLATGHPYSQPLIPIWNSMIRLIFYVMITFLLSALRKAAERESELARTDSLTGAVNVRYFYELAEMEIGRLQRYNHPITLVYIDVDNFKSVNDLLGHSIGDQVLHTVVSSARKHLRKADVMARLGGDEFALLLPETNEESARIILSRIQGQLLEEMQNRNWSITFSIGVLTCTSTPDTTAKLVEMADELMYSAKRGGKNAIRFSMFEG